GRVHCSMSSLSLMSVIPSPAPTEASPLSLHDALPISVPGAEDGHGSYCHPLEICGRAACCHERQAGSADRQLRRQCWQPHGDIRSEEHTSELQSREKLVCRPLLEKKTSRSHDHGMPGA